MISNGTIQIRKHNEIANSLIFTFDTICFCFNGYFFLNVYIISRIRNSKEMTIK